MNLGAPDYTSGDPNHLHVGSIQKEIHKFNLKEQYWRIIFDCINPKVLSSNIVLQLPFQPGSSFIAFGFWEFSSILFNPLNVLFTLGL